MYCSNCGAKCSDEAQFCMKCGQRLAHHKDENAGYGSDGIPVHVESIKNTASQSNNVSLAEEGILPKIRFPVAGIFFALHGILFLYCSMHMNGNPAEPFIGIAFFTWQTWISLFLLFASAALLFLKKIKPFSTALVAYSIWHTICYIVAAFRLIPNDIQNYYPRAFLSVLFDILVENAIAFSYGMMAILAIMTLMKENRFSSIAKRFWYIPGSLFCLVIALTLLLRGIRMPWWFIIVDLVFPITEIILSGWWLAHPYRTQSTPICHPNQAVRATSSYGRGNMALKLSPGNTPDDAPSFGYAVLGFFIPVSGLILYLVWKEQTPLRAKSAGKGALIGVIVLVIINILMVALSFILPWIMLRGYY